MASIVREEIAFAEPPALLRALSFLYATYALDPELPERDKISAEGKVDRSLLDGSPFDDDGPGEV